MGSLKFSYQRLRKLPILSSTQQEQEKEEEEEEVVRRNNISSSRWLRLRSGRRRRRRIRIFGLRRLIRRKARVVSGAVKKVLKRLKEGRPYLGEIFAGNYMFMQLTPNNSKKYPSSNFLDNKYSFLPGGGQYNATIAAAAAANKFNINPRLYSLES